MTGLLPNIVRAAGVIVTHEGKRVVRLDDAAGYAAELAEKFADGQAIQITVEDEPIRQGSAGMRYYRGPVLDAIRVAQGYTDPDAKFLIHRGLKEKFLRDLGTTNKRVCSRQRLAKYIDDVILYAECDLFICIPKPDRAYRWWRQQAMRKVS